MLTYLEERSAQFPGLTLAQSYIRRYPHGDLAAQLLGFVGQISASSCRHSAKHGFAAGRRDRAVGDRVGVQHVPARHRRLGAGSRRLARPAAEPADAVDAARSRARPSA